MGVKLSSVSSESKSFSRIAKETMFSAAEQDNKFMCLTEIPQTTKLHEVLISLVVFLRSM